MKRTTKQALPPVRDTGPAGPGCEPGARTFRCGKLRMIVGRSNAEGWHMSISHPTRYPTWDEIAHARYSLMPPDIMVGILLPPADDYVNLHDNCFNVWECSKYKPVVLLP